MTNLPATATEPTFPSMMHLQHLRRRLKENHGFLKAFSQEDRWQFHAYDRAFRRHFLGNDRVKSPIDPEGKWFNDEYAKAAETIYTEQREDSATEEAQAAPLYPTIVRSNWRSIVYWQLSAAEQQLFREANNRKALDRYGFPTDKPTVP